MDDIVTHDEIEEEFPPIDWDKMPHRLLRFSERMIYRPPNRHWRIIQNRMNPNAFQPTVEWRRPLGRKPNHGTQFWERDGYYMSSEHWKMKGLFRDK